MSQFHTDPRAVTAGLLMPPSPQENEPRLTDAGLFFALGAMAHDDEVDDETRGHHLVSLKRVLDVAKKDKEFPLWGEAFLLTLFSEGVDPLGFDDKERLLATLCRHAALCVGHGRMGSLIADEYIH